MSTPHETRPSSAHRVERSRGTAPGTPPAGDRFGTDDAVRPAGSRAAAPTVGGPRRDGAEWGAWSVKTLFFGATDLVVDAVLGTLWLTALVALVATGTAFLAAVVGLAVLVATIYAARGIEWVERRRTQAAFGLHLPALHRRRSPRTDGWRIPHPWWLDVSESPACVARAGQGRPMLPS